MLFGKRVKLHLMEKYVHKNSPGCECVYKLLEENKLANKYDNTHI